MSELLNRNTRLLNSNNEFNWKDEVLLNNKMLYFIEKCICRSTGFSTGAHINMKLMLRDQALSKLYGNNETKEHLRYSSFATDTMFGPVPTGFARNLDPHSAHRDLYILSSIPPSSTRSNLTRTPASKRASSFPDPKSTKAARPAPNQSQLISASDALKDHKPKGFFLPGRG